MSAFSFLACSFSTAMVFLTAEVMVLFFMFQFEKVRSTLLQKMSSLRYIILLAFFVQIAVIYTICIAERSENGAKHVSSAWARLWPKGQPSSDNEIPIGIVEFQEFQNEDDAFFVMIRGRITNISPFNAKHGFHIHETTNYTSGCDSTGGHYNPLKTNHGDIAKPEIHRHVGDLGNVLSDENGLVNVDMSDKIIRLTGHSAGNIVNLSLVIHADEDDLGLGESASSKVNGNSGKRLACGTIVLRRD